MTDIDDRIALGPIGVWRGGQTDDATARELERLGYGTLWLGSSRPPT